MKAQERSSTKILHGEKIYSWVRKSSGNGLKNEKSGNNNYGCSMKKEVS